MAALMKTGEWKKITGTTMRQKKGPKDVRHLQAENRHLKRYANKRPANTILSKPNGYGG